jgi:pilus assembly protein CpaB
MKTARVVVLGLTVLAAGGVAYVVNGLTAPEPVKVAAPVSDTMRILVAATDLNVGTALGESDIRWQEWPVAASSPAYITQSTTPDAIKEWTGAVARAPFVAGEPIRPQKLIKGNGSGFMSAILPAGMRAVATKIAVDTAAGGFILPNDRVDVIMTRRDTAASKDTGSDTWTTETILKNVRILAIDQTIEEKDGQKVITGSTATLELAPRQTEVLALAKEIGALSLTLRSLADSNPNAVAPEEQGEPDNKGLAVVRYGVVSNVVNR